MKPTLRTIRLAVWLAVAGVACLAGCLSRPPEPAKGLDLYERLQHENPSVRIDAIRQAALRDDAQAVPLLVDRLEDNESDVRFYAGQALQRITGTLRGWRYWEPDTERAKAVRRWREWLADQPTSRPTADGESPS